MNCSSCHRILASTLSVCPSCGAMVHDTVREELALKIVPIAKKKVLINTEKPNADDSMKLSNLNISRSISIAEAPKDSPINLKEHLKEDVEQNDNPIVPKKTETAKIMIKATSPTLVGFQNKNTNLPDWRLQLQNSVRKRLDQQRETPINVEVTANSAVRRSNLSTNGATALKVEVVEEVATAPQVDIRISNALKRIEASRQKYLVKEPVVQEITKQPIAEQNIVKPFPVLPNKTQDVVPKHLESLNTGVAKPNVVQFYDETKVAKFDTNKLPQLPDNFSSNFENPPIEYKKIVLDLDLEDDLLEIPAALNRNEKTDSIEIEGSVENYVEDDDYAPIALRFNAALFDLLICSFLSLILLSPFMLLNGRFFSIEGFFAFLATSTIVTFIYLTTSIGFIGRTVGMKMFSLEIYDIEGDDYPTLHQAAVSSSVYLFSLAFGGIGFLTMLINQERRAVHDLISRTIIIKE